MGSCKDLPEGFTLDKKQEADMPKGFTVDKKQTGVPEGFILDKPKGIGEPADVLSRQMMSQIVGLDRPQPEVPFKAQYPNIYAAGATLKDIPGQVSELGDAILSGATGTLSERAKEAGSWLSRKLFGEGKPGGVTGEWEESKLPGYMKTGGELAGAVVPVGLAGKLIAAPIIQVVSKSKHLTPFARIIGWGTAGATYEGVTSMLAEGELPTPKELAKHGAIWGGIEAVVSSIGWGGKLTIGVTKLSKLWGIPKKEVLKTVMKDAKAKGIPVAKHIFAKAKVQKALSIKEKDAAKEFVNHVDDLAKPFEKRGTYQDLTKQLEGKEIEARIKSFETYASKGFVFKDAPLVPRQVKAAALRYPDGTVVTGATHVQCLEKASKMGLSKRFVDKNKIADGFVDMDGKFMSRQMAKKLIDTKAGKDMIEAGAAVPPEKKGVTLGFGITGELQRMYEKLIGQRLHKPVAVKMGDLVPKEPSELGKKMIAALSEAKVLRGKQEEIYFHGRAEKLAKMIAMGKKTTGEGGFYKELGTQKGKMLTVQFKSIRSKLSQEDIDGLFNEVKDCPLLSTWEKLPARQGLAQLFGEFGGAVPTTHKLGLLKEVFGEKFVETALKKQGLWKKMKEAGYETLNVPKALMASYDLSAPLRQGIFLINRPKHWFPAFRDMFKYFSSKSAYQNAMREIKQRPSFDLAMKHRLSLTDLGGMSTREEAFMSNYAEKIPIIGRGVKASSQAFTGFLNQLRIGVFEDFIAQGAKLGLKDPKFLSDAARFVNHATGRGSLGQLESSAVQLNATFFSPRLITSRLQLLNPVFYAKLEPHVRKEALKSLFTLASVATTVASVAVLNGAKVGIDPRSADFMKLKFGSTRYDILGGFQQPIRLASQLLMGEIVSTTTGKTLTLGEGYKPITRLGIAGRFLEYKEAPVFSFVMGLARGTTAMGEKFEIPTEAMNRVIPMMMQDMAELYNEEGLKGIPLTTPAIFGVGVQTYGGVSSYGLKGKNYPLLNTELDRLQMPMGFPGTCVYGQELTTKEYKHYKVAAGSKIAKALTKTIQEPGYTQLPDNEKKWYIEKTIDMTKSEVKQSLFPQKYILSQLAGMIRKQQHVPPEEAMKQAKELVKKQRK